MKTAAEPDGEAQGWRILTALAVAQAIVAIISRAALWDIGGPLDWPRLAYFLYWDFLAIGCLMAVGAAALAATVRWRRWRILALTLVSTFATIHCLLLAANVTAVFWLRVPISWQWLYFSDLGRTQTPLAIAGSVLSPLVIAGAVCALLAPFAIWRILRAAVPIRALGRERWTSLLLIGAMFILPLAKLGDPPVRDRWRDAVSNPGAVLVSSILTDATARLEDVEGDGRTGDYLAWPASPPAPELPEERPDIVLVVLESVGRDHVFANRAVLPALDSLIGRGTIFPNAGVTNSNSVRSIFELYFSRFPVVGYQPESYLYDRVSAVPMPVAMERAGYRTALFMASDLGYQEAGAFLERHAVTGLNDIDRIACPRRIALSGERWQDNDYLPDDCVFDAAAKWLLHPGEPAFVTVWSGPTHFPYSPQTGAPAADPKVRHLQALQDTDRALGEMLAKIDAAGRDPLVIVVGDHGEAFGDHGTNVHGYTIFEDDTAIPLIMAGPGIAERSRDDRLATLADIGPTLLDYIGGGRPAGWQGLSALSNRQRERHFRFAVLDAPTVGYRTAERKYVLNLRGGDAVIYDLKADPGEQSPIPANAAQQSEIERAVAGWMRYNRALNEAR